MAQIERPAALEAPTGRVIGLRDRANPTQNSRGSQPFVSVLRKNALEEIRVGLSEFNGHDLINIRVWAEPRNGGTERIPTKSGIAANVRLLPSLVEALRQAEALARERGLL